eukprot:1158741-Pelagomonas_calceolata.AAC.3
MPSNPIIAIKRHALNLTVAEESLQLLYSQADHGWLPPRSSGARAMCATCPSAGSTHGQGTQRAYKCMRTGGEKHWMRESLDPHMVRAYKGMCSRGGKSAKVIDAHLIRHIKCMRTQTHTRALACNAIAGCQCHSFLPQLWPPAAECGLRWQDQDLGCVGEWQVHAHILRAL